MGTVVIIAGVPLILCLIGVALGLPAITTTTDSPTGARITTQPVKTITAFSDGKGQCQSAWQKFLIDFDVQYENDSERQKRNKIFCINWQNIRDHNLQYDSGLQSFKKGINQWSDLTIEEWKEKQRPKFHPEMSGAEITTKASASVSDTVNCLSAWEKFLIDFERKYQDTTETEKRRNIFCDNWKAIQKHNVKYELGVESFKKGINQWSDLTIEEWKNKQRPILAPEFSKKEFTTEMSKVDQNNIICEDAWKKFLIDFGAKYHDAVEVEKRRNIFCGNWKAIQEHNVKYELGVESFKKGINQWSDLTFEEWKNKQRPILAPEFPKKEFTTEISKVDQNNIICEDAWKKFLIDFGAKYHDAAEVEKRRNIFCGNWKAIQEHNVKYELDVESFKKGINQWSDLTFEEWKNKQRPILAPEFPIGETTK
ncbi:hypothetical protein KR084_012309 [Drosophila pseudotakahashii]|nr:hypothetical protein KR084_012309 [Drosophila pseudotakahashii]